MLNLIIHNVKKIIIVISVLTIINSCVPFDNSKYNPSPYYYKTASSNIAVLVIHGYLASAQQMIYINEMLKKENINVFCPNLAGHGTKVEDLEGITYDIWVEQIKNLYIDLRKKYDKVYIIGLSLGAQIALKIAELYDNINGIVIINVNIDYSGTSLPYAEKFKKLIKYVPNPYDTIKDKKTIGKFSYKKVPVKTSLELLYLSNDIRKDINKITVPILIFKSIQDHYIEKSSIENLFKQVSSKNKKLVFLNNSYHDAVLDYDKDIILKDILAFIKE